MSARTARIEGSLQIDVPPEALFDLVSDQRNEPQYNPNLRRVRKLTDGPIGVGTLYSAEMTTRSGVTPMTIEVTAFERPGRLSSATRLDAMAIDGELTLDPTPSGTRLHWAWDVQPKGALALMTPVVRWMGVRQERRIWTGLKQYVEDPARHTAPERQRAHPRTPWTRRRATRNLCP
jgi:uncharacterized protein YndB with AHSA1/START domain